MMDLRKSLYPVLSFTPHPIRSRFFSEAWLKTQIRSNLREHEEALTLKIHPLPYVELQVDVENNLPVDLQIYGIHVELWLGKPIVQFSSFVSESLHPGDLRRGLTCISFINSYQTEILNPPKKDSNPPNVTVVYTLSCRSSLGSFEKTVKSSWVAPVVLPRR